ncbi:proline racemase family protein [Bacillus sp. FJAT-29790]|uniref:proline racemase family protein n=1 Tax=Bacillus sp. FJAT-29790 TaxID=1895002 RepID=UPI001C22301A|nr:proline racemase family protein [Bacillus sp. FJAT-29790]MBU8880669.1 proline racemase family protein [Bacillus sp. FJAT-29790]
MIIQKVYQATDVHVAGEAFRIIKDVPFIHYQSLEQLNEQFPHVFADEINLLLNEPRGFAGLNGCLVVPPFSREADAAVVFFNHDGTVPLHYGGIVAVMTALLECGHLPARASGEYKIETVSGLISVTAIMEKEEVVLVKLESEPCQVIEKEVQLSHPRLNTKLSLVQADQLYAVFEKHDIPAEIRVEDLSELKRWGQTVLQALDSKTSVNGAILLDATTLEEGRIKTLTFREDEFIVRSPGFGTTLACYTSLFSKGGMCIDKPYVNESIFGSRLEVEAARQTESGYQFTLKSRGFITGLQTFVLDPTDPLAAGFLLK